MMKPKKPKLVKKEFEPGTGLNYLELEDYGYPHPHEAEIRRRRGGTKCAIDWISREVVLPPVSGTITYLERMTASYGDATWETGGPDVEIRRKVEIPEFRIPFRDIDSEFELLLPDLTGIRGKQVKIFVPGKGTTWGIVNDNELVAVYERHMYYWRRPTPGEEDEWEPSDIVRKSSIFPAKVRRASEMARHQGIVLIE